MPKIPQCAHCLYYANDHHLLCAAHPHGPDEDTCLEFSPDPELEGKRFIDFIGLLQQSRETRNSSESFSNPFDLEPVEDLWEPEGASYYAGELILQPQERWTRAEQLELLDTHPLFTQKCPECNRQFLQAEKPLIHWDCPSCGWIDDSV